MANAVKAFDPEAGVKPSLPSDVFIVANASDIEALTGSDLEKTLGRSAVVPLPPDAPLPQELVAQAKVLVLEVDPENAASLRRISQIRERRDELPIIAALHETNVSLVKTLIQQGIRDVAVLPFAAEELTSQIVAAAVPPIGRDRGVRLAPMLVVAGSTGGCGTTTIITHLAAELAQRCPRGRSVCVVDLDLQNGDIAYYLGETPKITVSTLLEAGDRLDAELLHGAITDSRYGFSLIAAPKEITPLDVVGDDEHLLKLLKLIRKEFDFVLVDLPTAWTNWSLSACLASTDVMLVTGLSLVSLRQAKRRLELFSAIGLDPDRIRLVVNRAERKWFRSVGVDQVREVLGCDVMAVLPDEGDALRAAQDEGRLITDVNSRSGFSAEIKALAQALIGDLEGEVESR